MQEMCMWLGRGGGSCYVCKVLPMHSMICPVSIACGSSKMDGGIATPWAPEGSSVIKEALNMSIGKQLYIG